jgi:hypothetical protein
MKYIFDKREEIVRNMSILMETGAMNFEKVRLLLGYSCNKLGIIDRYVSAMTIMTCHNLVNKPKALDTVI